MNVFFCFPHFFVRIGNFKVLCFSRILLCWTEFSVYLMLMMTTELFFPNICHACPQFQTRQQKKKRWNVSVGLFYWFMFLSMVAVHPVANNNLFFYISVLFSFLPDLRFRWRWLDQRRWPHCCVGRHSERAPVDCCPSRPGPHCQANHGWGRVCSGRHDLLRRVRQTDYRMCVYLTLYLCVLSSVSVRVTCWLFSSCIILFIFFRLIVGFFFFVTPRFQTNVYLLFFCVVITDIPVWWHIAHIWWTIWLSTSQALSRTIQTTTR
jgi:hypothetical protein